MLKDAQIPVSIATFLQCLIFVNQDIYPDWVTTVQPVSVIWVSSGGLCLLIIKTLVLAKLHSFIQTIIYSKLAAFLPITFLEWKIYLKILYICGNLRLSVTNCQVCVLLNLFVNLPMVSHPQYCLFHIVQEDVAWHQISYVNFFQGVISSNQGKIRYPWYSVIRFHALKPYKIEYLWMFCIFSSSLLSWVIVLHILIMKALVSLEIDSFLQLSVCGKPLPFLLIALR